MKSRFFKPKDKNSGSSLMKSSFIELLAVIIIIFMCSLIVLYINTVNSIENKFDILNYEDTRKICNLSDMLLKELETSMINASTDSNIQTYIYADNPGELFTDINERLFSCMSALKGTKTYIDSVYVYSGKRNSIFTDKTDSVLEDFPDKECMEKFSEAKPIYAWGREKGGVYPHVISIMLRLTESGESGALIINVDTLKFIKNLMNFNDIKDFYMIDGNGRIIYSSATQDISKNIINVDYYDIVRNKDIENIERDGKRVSISNVRSKYYDWNYINVNTAKQYVEEMNSMLRNFALMLLCFILVSVLIAYIYARRNSRPIKSIIDIIENSENINAVQKLKHSEVKYLACHIIMMMEANKQLKTELNETISRANKAHVLLLQAQINPHFLYNTLNVINWTIEEEVPEGSRSSEMIIGLSTLLRVSIDFKNILIPLEDEIRYTKIYIDLMESRYKDDFDVTFDFDEEILDKQVIKLFMQPIIENSIVHGFKNMKKKGHIKITGRADTGCMVIKIADNGSGIDDAVLREINKKFVFDEMYIEKNIGVKNVKFRLDTIWGEDASLWVERRNGTIITVKIPIS